MNKKGFTLIELLVVMAIIGILASIVLVALNSSRAKGRDTKRSQEVKLIEGAIEVYFSNNGQYPSVGTDGTAYAITTLQSALAPNYLPTIPQDPLYAGVTSGIKGDYQYARGGAGSYGIWVYVETPQGSVPASSRCVAGVSTSTAWFGSYPACPF